MDDRVKVCMSMLDDIKKGDIVALNQLADYLVEQEDVSLIKDVLTSLLTKEKDESKKRENFLIPASNQMIIASNQISNVPLPRGGWVNINS